MTLLESSIAGFLVVLGCGFVAAAGTSLFTKVLRRYARQWNLLDRPLEGRKIHTEPVATAGGIAIAGGVILGVVVLHLGERPVSATALPLFWAGAVVVLGTGLWDDIYGMDPKGKFLLQVIAAYLLLHAGFHIEVGEFSFAWESGFERALYSIPLSVIWVVGIINAVNLTDGTDGLAAGVLAIAFLACATLYGLKGHIALMGFGVVVAGALVGFLPYNFEPASIFMGDSGSLFLGYLISAYALQSPLHSDPYLALLILPFLLGIPVLDTGTAILRRLTSEERNVFAPDTGHIHHRLVANGSEKRAALTLYAAEGWFGSAAILMGTLPPAWGYTIAVGTMVISVGWIWQLGCLQPISSEEETVEQDTTVAPARANVALSRPDDSLKKIQGEASRETRNVPTPEGRTER